MDGHATPADEIRNLLARYADSVRRKDAEDFSKCFTKDGEWTITGMTMRGRFAIGDQFCKFLAKSNLVMMFHDIPLITISGESGTGSTQITEYIKRNDGSAIRTLGVYKDKFAHCDGIWLFEKRELFIYYRGSVDFSDQICDLI